MSRRSGGGEPEQEHQLRALSSDGLVDGTQLLVLAQASFECFAGNVA